MDRVNYAKAAKIAIKIPSPIEQILTEIVIIVAIKNSSPHPVSPKINKLNLSIKKEAAKAASYLIDFFYKLHRHLTTKSFFLIFVAPPPSLIYVRRTKINSL